MRVMDMSGVRGVIWGCCGGSIVHRLHTVSQTIAQHRSWSESELLGGQQERGAHSADQYPGVHFKCYDLLISHMTPQAN